MGLRIRVELSSKVRGSDDAASLVWDDVRARIPRPSGRQGRGGPG